ncbi:hypothetical protein EV421DRAFT_1907995 [Armillaria borealis]|uniref:Uncharacterized protein n=1 Tax=Armillaria borealis TaxID=47425 RepID=A0AA39J8W3_9AGAR|nr:hypothetical protein EV421DRAFT_1907995 [Armillaria borealis]
MAYNEGLVSTFRDTADDSNRRTGIIGATIGGVVFCVVLPLFLIVSISTVESVAPDHGPISDLLGRPPQSSRTAYEEMIEWLQRQIRHMDGEGIMRSTSPAPPSYHSLHRIDIPDPSCSSSPPP